MLPRNRIRLIREIAPAIGKADWDEIDFVLSQHGIATAPGWHGEFDTRTKYVVKMVEDVSDEALLELRAFLDSETVASEPRASSELWQPRFFSGQRFFRLFLSHTSAYKKEMGTLKSALLSRAVMGFVAHEDIEPAREWENVIRNALRSCEALVAYVTPDFPESRWTDQEVGFCVGRDVPVVPIKAGLDPYGFIGRYQAIPGVGRDADFLAEQLVGILRREPRTLKAMAEATVERFIESHSFASARDNFSRIRQIPSEAWTSELIQSVLRASDENGQISDAYD